MPTSPQSAEEAFPRPNQTCVWPIGGGCTLKYATVVADLPLCLTHATEALQILLIQKGEPS